MQTIHRFQNYVYSGLSQFFYIIWAAWFCLISHTALAQPVLDIQQWKTYGPLAEQGAICASFAAIMESQDVITPDLGHLWTERRKFSGALIRNAATLELGTVPDTQTINAVIANYREWVLANLIQGEVLDEAALQSGTIALGQNQIRQIIKSNCQVVYQQADIAILKRFPELAYLTGAGPVGTKGDKAAIASKDSAARQNKDAATIRDLRQQLEQALARNMMLNRDLASVQAQLAKNETAAAASATTMPTGAAEAKAPAAAEPSASTPAKLAIATPTKRPTPPPAAIKPAKTKPASTTSAGTTSDRFIAQLGSYSQKALAEAAIASLSKKMPELFAANKLSVSSHTLSSGNRFFRVLSQPLGREQVKTLCDALWAERLGCLIKSAP